MSLRLPSNDVRRLAESLRITSFYDFPATFGSAADVTAETAARIAADANLQAQINALSAMLAGGTAGQVLVKNSGTDYDASWQTLALPIAGAHVDSIIAETTTSATFVDIVGLSLTLTNTVACKYLVALTASIDTTGPGGATTAAYAISIDGVDQDEQHIDFPAVSIDETAATIHVSTVLAPGIHTFKGRFRRVSGAQTVEFSTGTLSAVALQATP